MNNHNDLETKANGGHLQPSSTSVQKDIYDAHIESFNHTNNMIIFHVFATPRDNYGSIYIPVIYKEGRVMVQNPIVQINKKLKFDVNQIKRMAFEIVYNKVDEIEQYIEKQKAQEKEETQSAKVSTKKTLSSKLKKLFTKN